MPSGSPRRWGGEEGVAILALPATLVPVAGAKEYCATPSRIRSSPEVGPISAVAVPVSVRGVLQSNSSGGLMGHPRGKSNPSHMMDFCQEGSTTTVSPGSSMPLASELPVSEGSTTSTEGRSVHVDQPGRWPAAAWMRRGSGAE